MSPEAWALAVGIAALIASAVVFFVSRRMIAQGNAQIARCDEAVTKAGELIKALTAERDEALRLKASQWEAWQSESTNLRADVAALERKCEAMKTDRDRFWSHLDATRDRLASAESDLRAAYAELALLRPIADSAEKFMDGNHLPGEWAEVRAAIRARKEAKL